MKTAPDNHLQELSGVQKTQYNGIANRIISKIMTKIFGLVFIITTSFRQIGGVLGGCDPLRTTSNRFHLKTPHFSAITPLSPSDQTKQDSARKDFQKASNHRPIDKKSKGDKKQKKEKRGERKRKDRKREKTKKRKREKKRQGSSRLLTIGFRACQRFL